ncbi:MAG TPA: YceD family protein [Streptosporangiaceae bacterium]|nr:YceD family protein [Streptosporangiaceae bacterium]
MPAPAALGSGLVRVPEGSDLELEVQLEDVTGGVLVTASVTAALASECARCLDEFTSSTQVSFQELFAVEAGGSGDDGYLLDGDLLDLEPALRDALVLELPLSPLCSPDCAGLCSKCGIRLADAEPDHRHPDDGGVWAVLKDLFPADEAGGADQAGEAEGRAETEAERRRAPATENGPASNGRQQNTSSTGTSRPAGSKER